MKRLLSLLLITMPFMAPLVAHADDCDHTRDIKETIDASSIANLNVIARAGKLKIAGYKDGNDIYIDAKLCSDSKKVLKVMDVTFEAGDDTGEIETIMAKDSWLSSGNHKIDLALKVPQRLMLDVLDSSGSVLVEGVAGLNIDDSSGSLDINSIAGDLNLKDGSGSIGIRQVGGSVTLSDGSGAISVENVGTDVLVTQDGSGSISVRNVAGDFVVNDDGSGSISAANIGGHFWVREDGSGSINFKNIGGKVDIPKK